jgi:hypothetical protein
VGGIKDYIFMSQFNQNFITVVIDLYGLEIEDRQVDTLIVTWLQQYDNSWIIKAIVESLYRGRYKVKSVDNILRDWQRLGKPRHNFTPEYEREILQNLPDLTDLLTVPRSSTISTPVVDGDKSVSLGTSEQEHRLDPKSVVTQPVVLSSKNLNPEESAPFQCHHHSVSADRLGSMEVGTIAISEAPISADSDSILCWRGSANDSLSEDDFHTFITLPLSSLAILHRRSYASGDLHPKVKADRASSQPAKFQLFKTLKAIVDPHHQKGAAVDNLVDSTVFAEETSLSHITKFKLPRKNIGEEQCL